MEHIFKIIHPLKYYRDYLKRDIRPDGRGLSHFRPVIINVDTIKTSDGSAIVKIGDTSIVCGIKAELSAPNSREPDKGFIIPNLEYSPICSSKYRPGPPSMDAQIATHALVEILNESKCVDLSNLCIEYGKLVWVLYVDLLCLSYDGCLLDTSLIAFMSSLKSLKLPEVTYNSDTDMCEVDINVQHSLIVNKIPVSTTFIIFDSRIITDPDKEEEDIANSISVVTSNSKIIYLYQPGGTPYTPDFLTNCVKEAFKRETSVGNLINSVVTEE